MRDRFGETAGYANYEVIVMNGNVIKIVPLNSWDDFIKHLRRSSYDVPDYFYRGQGDHTWSLVPTLQRTLEYPISTREFYLNRMREYLRAFRDHAHGLTGFPDGLTHLDRLLTLGRHHGLVTRSSIGPVVRTLLHSLHYSKSREPSICRWMVTLISPRVEAAKPLWLSGDIK